MINLISLQIFFSILVTCNTGDTQASCGECPKPTEDNDSNCEGGGDCEVVRFFTSFDPVKFNPQSELFCTSKFISQYFYSKTR